MDKRSYFGLVLVGLLLVVMTLLMGNNKKNNAPQQAKYAKELAQKQLEKDSIKEATYAVTPIVDSLSALFPSMYASSIPASLP